MHYAFRVCLGNIEQQLAIADGAVTGTAFKRDGYIWNEVDPNRVSEFMQVVRRFRESLGQTRAR
jgi:predicted TIM-barrel enzyme